MNGIFTTLLYEMEKHHDTVLCTIIADSGSTPRGKGAQMLVGETGLLSGTIGGVADSFLDKKKAKTIEAKLARATQWVGAVVVVLTLALNVLQ